MTNILYRFYSATGQLLYVGITTNPPTRFNNHRDQKWWWNEVTGITLEHCADRHALAAAERRAIQIERPMHNVVHNGAAKLHRPTAPQPGWGRNQIEADGLCPVCRREVFYHRGFDRYFHMWGENNRECWVAISSGELDDTDMLPLSSGRNETLDDLNEIHKWAHGEPSRMEIIQ